MARWRAIRRSPPTPLKNLLSAKSRVLTEAERGAIAEEVSGKMKARITQGPGAVHDAISAFLDAVDPAKTLQVKALAVQPSVRHALAVRGAKDGDVAWLGLKVKAAAARTGTGQVNLHITISEVRTYVSDGFAVLFIGLDVSSPFIAFVFHGPADLATLSGIEGSKIMHFKPFAIGGLSDVLRAFRYDLRGEDGRNAAQGRLASALGSGCALVPLSQSCIPRSADTQR